MTGVNKAYYADLTFPEVREIVAERRMPLLPVGTLEEHGHHAPVATDCVGPMEVCRLTASLLPNDVIVMPPVYYGFGGFNTNFPGTVNITEQNFIGYVADILFSLATHGFEKIIIVNGHGGNVPYLNLAMRRLNMDRYPETVACVIMWWDLIPQDSLQSLSESEYGGMGNAGELETSVALPADPNTVQMDKAFAELWDGDLREGAARATGTSGGTPLGVATYVGWMGGMGGSRYGIMGDPTVATAEKGEKWLAIAAENLAKFVSDWKQKPIEPVADHH